MNQPETYEEESAREEPEITVLKSLFPFMPQVRVEVAYPAVNGESVTALHLSPQGALQLYTKLGEHLKTITTEEI